MTVLLAHGGGFAWHRRGPLRAKGYLVDAAGTFRQGEALLDHFVSVADEEGLERKLREANGCFAVVVETDRQLLAAVDPVRSIPLFHAAGNGSVVVGDDVHAIRQEIGGVPGADPVSREEVLRVGYALGPRTIDPRVAQIEAGEFRAWDRATGQGGSRLYFSHAHGEDSDAGEEALLDELDGVTDRWVRRLIESAEGRPLVVPLSGGYDSRYVVCALKRAGCGNVVCYSYGAASSPEWRVARDVAERLGYPIHVVEYDRANWQAALDSPRFAAFCRLSAQRCAVPCIQELSAREQLEGRKAWPAGAVVVPGYCGDLQGGSYVPAAVAAGQIGELLAEGVPTYLFRLLFTLRSDPLDPGTKEAILRRIGEYTDRFPAEDGSSFCSVLEDWFIRHKVAKFVLNALRAHELFGSEWRLPLWDADWVRWWQRIPLRFRIGSVLYRRFLFERLFEPMGVDFRKPSPGRSLPSAVRSRLPLPALAAAKRLSRRAFPGFFRRQNDVDAFDEVSRILLGRMPGKPTFRDFQNVNGVVGAWCDLQGL